MMKRNKKSFNPGTYFTFIGAILICAVIFTDAIPEIYILSVLGALCMAYGVLGLLKNLRAGDGSAVPKSVFQLCVGAFVAFIGILEGSQAQMSETFWNGLLLLAGVMLLFWLLLRIKNKGRI